MDHNIWEAAWDEYSACHTSHGNPPVVKVSPRGAKETDFKFSAISECHQTALEATGSERVESPDNSIFQEHKI